MGVVIDTPQLRMEIKFVAVNSLFTHEETIPSALEKLKQELLEEGILKHPIIVDTDTYVVLDGMHRVAALKSLNCNIVPVCLVDYQNPAIELYAWYREFEGNATFTEFLKRLSHEDGLNQSQIISTKAREVVDKRNAMAALAHGETALLLTHNTSLTIKETYDAIATIELIAEEMGYEIIYNTEADALQHLQSEHRLVLIVPSLTKKEVVESALKHQLFTQKTTRHVVPARPLFTNVPLSWLKTTDLGKANEKLYAHLNSKKILKKDPGSIIDGRRYEERAYLFLDP